MAVYSVIMLLTGAAFAYLSVRIYRGKTHLIHDYHQKKVRDKADYAKAFGKALAVISLAMLSSGILPLIGGSDALKAGSVAVLVLGIGVGVVCIVLVQRKYNGGVF